MPSPSHLETEIAIADVRFEVFTAVTMKNGPEDTILLLQS
jgi:hypothetical protein